jgi:hypothetical protein
MKTVMIFQRYISCGKIVFYCKLIATIKWKKRQIQTIVSQKVVNRIVDVSALLRVIRVN